MGKLKTIRRKKMIAQRGRCYYCGVPMWDGAACSTPEELRWAAEGPKFLRCTAEHLRARCEGGGDSDDNIVAACWYCNTRRHRRKCPLAPEAYRQHVRRRMAARRWLAVLDT